MSVEGVAFEGAEDLDGGVAFVAGATGYVGRALVRRFQAGGVPVVAHVRPESAADARTLSSLATGSGRVDRTPWATEAMARTLGDTAPSRVFVVLGTTRRAAARDRRAGRPAGYLEIDRDLPLLLIAATLLAGVRPTFLYLSALGADPSSRNPYLRARGEVERGLAASPLPWVAARPAIVTGPDRQESRPLEKAASTVVDAVLYGLARVGWRGPLARYGTLDAEAVASALIGMSEDPAAWGRVIEGAALREYVAAA